MAEPVSLASGLLTLVVFAFDASKSLYEAISSFKSQRQTIKDALADLDSLVAVLITIREQSQRPIEVAKLEPLRQPLKCCATTCEDMRRMLDACTAHSKDSQASVRDWLKMQYRGKSFDDMKSRLSSYKTTLVITFQSINLYAGNRHSLRSKVLRVIRQDHSITQESLVDFKDLISGTKEDLEDQLEAVRQTINAADASLREILMEDQARLQSSLDSLAQAQRISDSTRPKVIIKDNLASSGSRAIFGTDTTQLEFDLEVINNEVGVGAVSSAGVHSPQTLQALLQDSRTPNLALALQALQTQSMSVRTEALESVLNVISAERNQGVPQVPTTSLLTEAESPDSVSLRQPVGSIQSVPASFELPENGLDRLRQ